MTTSMRTLGRALCRSARRRIVGRYTWAAHELDSDLLFACHQLLLVVGASCSVRFVPRVLRVFDRFGTLFECTALWLPSVLQSAFWRQEPDTRVHVQSSCWPLGNLMLNVDARRWLESERRAHCVAFDRRHRLQAGCHRGTRSHDNGALAQLRWFVSYVM